MTTSMGWAGLLQDGEEILWQGKPDAGIIWSNVLTVGSLFGVFFAGFAVFWMTMSAAMISGSGAPGPIALFPLFGMPFLLIGLYISGGHLVVDAYKRSKTWYTLTDRTAFIATEFLGRRTLDSYPLAAMPTIRLIDETPGSVLFAGPTQSRGGGRHARNAGRQDHSAGATGFRRIPDARTVYGQMRRARAALNARDDASGASQ